MVRFSRNQPRLFDQLLKKREMPVASRKDPRVTSFFHATGFVVLWTLFFGVVAYSLVFAPWFITSEIEIQGESVIAPSMLRESLDMYLDDRIAGIFPRNNLLLLREIRLEEKFLSEYPKFDRITLEKKWPNSLKIVVSERKKIAVWCSGGPCWSLGGDGKLTGTDRVWIPEYADSRMVLIDRSALPIEVDRVQPAISTLLDQTERFGELIPALVGIAIEPEVSTPSRFAHELQFKTSEGWIIFFNTEQDIQHSVEILRSLLLHELTNEKRERLQSIDLRTGGRAFLGYRESGIDEVSVPASSSELPQSDQKNKVQQKSR